METCGEGTENSRTAYILRVASLMYVLCDTGCTKGHSLSHMHMYGQTVMPLKHSTPYVTPDGNANSGCCYIKKSDTNGSNESHKYGDLLFHREDARVVVRNPVSSAVNVVFSLLSCLYCLKGHQLMQI
ncbi:hypothetical protein JOB18_001554 [Solea senegalensis]|uniref:Uncharacterized protein n=1 Tax=Solea senegalensis TaxID=28829 RepID=A0AAV6SIH4_SOLSE|nr:hypothetical protein JOB18_001554 [Solea senegalensis]